MAYGELKVDSITFTDGGTDTTVSVSGLIQNPTFSGDITVTGTISGDVILGGTTVSGATVTGSAGQFVTVTGNTAGFTTVTGTTVTGTTANFVTVSGTTVTGNAGNFTTATVTSGVFASGIAAAPSVSVGTTDNGLYSPGTYQVAISTNGTGRLFIDNNGRVGIGVTPTSVLHVKGPQPAIVFENSSGFFSALLFKTTGSAQNDYVIATNSSGTEFLSNQYTFKNVTGTAEYMRLDSSGRLGVGTSSPNVNLHVNSSGNTLLELSSTFLNSTSGIIINTTGDSSAGRIVFQKAGVQRGTFRFSHSATGNEQFSFNIAGGAEELVITTTGVGIGTTSPSSLLHLADAGDITVGTTTGTKIGTATSQKIGFYNATPVVQPTAVADITTTATSGSLPTPDGSVTIADAATPTVTELLKYCVELEAKLEAALGHLRTLGLIAT